MRSSEQPGDKLKLVASFFAIYVIWGSTYLAIRYAVDGLPPFLMMGIRHVIAGGLLYIVLRLRGESAPARQLWLPSLIAGGVCFLGGHGLLAWAEIKVSSGLAALLIACEPIIMVVLARMMGQEKFSSRTLFGLILGMAGIAVLFQTTARQGSVMGALAVVVASVFWSVGAIYARGVKTGSSAGLFAAMQMIVGGILLLATGSALGEKIHPAAVSLRCLSSLLYLIVFGSLVTFSAYTWLMRVTTAARVTTHCYVNPVVAVFLGWALAGETVTPSMLVGTAIVVASVILVTTKEQGREEPADLPLEVVGD